MVDFSQSNLGLESTSQLARQQVRGIPKVPPTASGWTTSCARPAAYSQGLVVGIAVRCNCHRVRRRCLAFGARETGRRGAAEILRGLRLPDAARGTLAGVGSGGQLAVAYLYEWFMFLARVRRRVHRTVRSSARASLCPISRTRSAPQIARRRLKKDRVWGHADYRGGPWDPGPTSGSYCRRTRRRPIDTPHSSVGLRGRMPGPVTRFCWSFRHVWPFQVAHDQA
jgi:hypothetical protein